MEEFTGLDIEKAKIELKRFKDQCDEVSETINQTFLNFFETLETKWASENAVAFGKKYSPKIADFLAEFDTHYLHVLSGAASAAQTIAYANGMSFGSTEEYNYMEVGEIIGAVDYYNRNIQTSINGVTGMVVANVQIALELLQNGIAKVITNLNELPKGIAFYSPDGMLRHTYNTNIEKFITQFEALCNEMVAEIKSYMETEIDNILLAKEQAQSIMNG